MESSDRHLIGEQLGTCVLKELIGVGGMGKVYLAQQTRPTRQVAVKVLKSGVGILSEAHQEFLARFRREANVIAQLDHINILPIYEYGEENGLAYLVMPYLTGGNLRTLLSEKGSLSPIEAFGYLEQAASALQYAHNHKIVHRDIKPANMLFHADGRLVLVDFGIARIIRDGSEKKEESSITATGYFMGSVDYMAPEMAKGMKVDHRADIYELGIVLFQMLTGQVPFQGRSPFMVAAMHINNPPPSVRQLKPSLSSALDAVVRRALAKNANDRYSTVSEFAEAFRRALSSSYSLLPNISYHPGGLSPFSGLANHALYTPKTSLTPEEQKYATDKTDTGQSQEYATVETDTEQPLETTEGQPQPPVLADFSGLANHALYTPKTPLTPEEQEYATDKTDTEQSLETTERQPQPPVLVDQHEESGEGMNAVQNLPVEETRLIQQWTPQALSSSPSYPHSVPPQRPVSRRHSWIWVSLLLVLLLVVLISGSVIFWPQIRDRFVPGSLPYTPVVSQTVTPTASPTKQARTALIRYYNYINTRNYHPAYMMWSVDSEYRRKNTYQQFAAGYADTAHVDILEGSITANDGSYHILVTLNALSTQGAMSRYTGYYDLKRVDGSWQIVGALIN